VRQLSSAISTVMGHIAILT